MTDDELIAAIRSREHAWRALGFCREIRDLDPEERRASERASAEFHRAKADVMAGLRERRGLFRLGDTTYVLNEDGDGYVAVEDRHLMPRRHQQSMMNLRVFEKLLRANRARFPEEAEA